MKIAVVLFNLGGPSDLKAVRPFLKNMFMDPAIISVPQPFRWMLAELISRRRAPIASEIYKEMGGKSPINEETEAQAKALQEALRGDGDYKVFYTQRYWHPMAPEVASEVRSYNPDQIMLVSLYPQFSSTTTASSIKQWREVAAQRGLTQPTKIVCCYPVDQGFINANIEMILQSYEQAKKHGKPRVLFSAHGIPQNRVDRGDPYQMQVTATTKAVVKGLNIEGLDYKITYQSKVGPLKWLEPSTEHEIEAAARDGVPLIVVPIAFVSEHSETLVELDIEYRELFIEHGGQHYFRVPTVRTHPKFIEGLRNLILSYQDRNCSNLLSTCIMNKYA